MISAGARVHAPSVVLTVRRTEPSLPTTPNIALAHDTPAGAFADLAASHPDLLLTLWTVPILGHGLTSQWGFAGAG